MTGMALDKQVDGSHYVDQAIQPLEIAYAFGGSPCFCKLVKYLTRNKGDRMINLQKALHCIELDQQLRGDVIYDDAAADISYRQAVIVLSKVTRCNLSIDAMYSLFSGDHNHSKLAVEELIAKEQKKLK